MRTGLYLVLSLGLLCVCALGGTVTFKDGRSKTATFPSDQIYFFRSDDFDHFVELLVANDSSATTQMSKLLVSAVKSMDFTDLSPSEKQALAKRFPQCNDASMNMCFVRKANLVLKHTTGKNSAKYKGVFVFVSYTGDPKGPEDERYDLTHFDIVGFDF